MRDKVERLARWLVGRAGYDVQVCSDLDATCQQANRWHSDGQLRALVAVGGDGTISDVVNRTEPGVPLAIFPGGTSNLIARHFCMEATPEMLFRTITAARLVRIDVGRAGDRLFVAMASCGFDAEVVAEVHRRRQAGYRSKGGRGGFLGYWSYVKPILASIRNYRYPEVRVYCDVPGRMLSADRQRQLPPDGRLSSTCRGTDGVCRWPPGPIRRTGCWTSARSGAGRW